MKNTPNTIFLTTRVNKDIIDLSLEDFKDVTDLGWNTESKSDQDIEYIRKDTLVDFLKFYQRNKHKFVNFSVKKIIKIYIEAR